MSAYVLDREDIITLTIAAARTSVIPPNLSLNQFGTLLWQENVTSVMYRYRMSDMAELPASVDDTPFILNMTTEDVKRNIDLENLQETIDKYCYNSCEHPAWEYSSALKYIDELSKAVIRDVARRPMGDPFNYWTM